MAEEQNYHPLDQAIRDKVELHDSPVSEDLWDAISGAVLAHDGAKKRRRALFFVLAFFISITALIFGIFIGPVRFAHKNSPEIDHIEHQLPISLEDNKTSLFAAEERASQESIIETAQSSTHLHTNSSAQTSQNTVQTSVNRRTIPATQQGTKFQVNAIRLTNSTTTLNASITAQSENFISSNQAELTDGKTALSANPNDENERIDELQQESTVSDHETSQDSPDEILPGELVSDEIQLDESSSTNKSAENDTIPTNPTSKSEVEDSLRKPKKIFFIALAGQGLRTSAFYKNTNLVAGQDEKIELAEGYGFAVQFGLKLPKKIELYSGLNFEKTELEQRLRSDNENFDFQTAFGEVHLEDDEDDFGDDFIFVERYFYYLEVPVGFRYKFIATNRFCANLNAELLFNYLINQSNRSEMNVTLNNAVGIKHLTLSSAFGLGLQLNLKGNFWITSDLRYNAMLQSISMQSNTIVRPYSFGLGFGLKKYF